MREYTHWDSVTVSNVSRTVKTNEDNTFASYRDVDFEKRVSQRIPVSKLPAFCSHEEYMEARAKAEAEVREIFGY